MNNSELDQKLKAARGPALDAGYTEDFPRTVLAGLRAAAPREPLAPRHSPRPGLVWGLATAVCMVIAFAAGHWHGRRAAGQDVLASSKLVGETLAMFPNRVRAIIRDDHGMNLILSDQPDVPASTPIYVRICDGSQCASVVTFSGQEIQIAGRAITVLSDAHGGIILEGNEFVWSSVAQNQATSGLTIRAKFL